VPLGGKVPCSKSIANVLPKYVTELRSVGTIPVNPLVISTELILTKWILACSSELTDASAPLLRKINPRILESLCRHKIHLARVK